MDRVINRESIKNKFKILDDKILNLIKVKLAKPNKTIEEHTIDLLVSLEMLNRLGYITDNRIYNLSEIACIYHDIGKFNEEFQKRVSSKIKKKFDYKKEVGHNILSTYLINEEEFDTFEDYLRVTAAVLNHHSYCDNIKEVTEKENQIVDLLEVLKTKDIEIYDIEFVLGYLSEMINDKEAIKVKGYLHKCDYSASSGQVVEYPNDFLNVSLDGLLKNWQEKIPESQWNELQRFCIENKEENIIAIGQTGLGKTEAGLLWIGDNKGFFVLPLRTAINAIYDRVRKYIIKDENVVERVAILHSSSLEYYINNLNSDNSEEDREEIDLIEYHKLGKDWAIPLSITTMDQIFDFVYKYQGYELKLTTLSYSKIVIDEIQAYGPDLLAYLICGIEKIVEFGGKVAILTATLPPFVKDLLKKKINFKEGKFTNDLRRHNLKIKKERINSDDIYEKYKENKERDTYNKILVVCNTVKEAQKIYSELKEKMKEENINILHSKFTREDRKNREKQIIQFGKTYEEDTKIIDKQNGIWIATQIVEASLDIDFDYLYTELQELNSLFQRLGRCNRKGAKDSSEYNCFIYTETDENNLMSEKKGFIDKRLYELSKQAIMNLDGQISEDEKIRIIEDTLTTDNLKGSDYMIKYREIYEKIVSIPPYRFNKDEVDLRNIESVDIIPNKVYHDNKEEIIEISNRLLNEKLEQGEKVRLRDDLMKFTVSVRPYEIKTYERALSNGKAIRYDNVELSRNKKDYIKVIECIYDEAGYRRMNYEEDKREVNIL